MRASAFQPDMGVVFRERIDEQPVRFKMAVTTARELAPQRMVFQLRRQRLAFQQQIKDRLELGKIPATLLGQFDVLLELTGPAETSHKPKSA